jgi:hypothetical protein
MKHENQPRQPPSSERVVHDLVHNKSGPYNRKHYRTTSKTRYISIHTTKIMATNNIIRSNTGHDQEPTYTNEKEGG